MAIKGKIIPPEDMPDPRDPLGPFEKAHGNILTLTEDVGHDRLDKIKYPADSIKALSDVIAELDKGDKGKFNNSWCMELDRREGHSLSDTHGLNIEAEWSHFLRSTKSWGLTDLGFTKESFCSEVMRSNFRKEAIKLLTYFKSGYQIEWGQT